MSLRTRTGTVAERERATVEAPAEGLRLDVAIARSFPGLSRRTAKVLLDLGGVFVGGTRVKRASLVVRSGERLEIVRGPAFERALRGEAPAPEGPSPEVVFEDADLWVVHKPAAWLTAPTPEGDRGSLADWLTRRLTPGLRAARAHVVHRLDLGTSGLLVFARSDLARSRLSEVFRVHDVERRYLAVAHGLLAEPLSLDAPIDGRPARTRVAPVERLLRHTLVEAELHTGRTHQVRLHLSGAGHPIAGDGKYGPPSRAEPPGTPRPPRLCLHAAALGFAHPRSGVPLRFEAPLPPDVSAWLVALRTLAASPP
jgi:23S rRNA pseudouridine1911/1915/1917 synthase